MAFTAALDVHYPLVPEYAVMSDRRSQLDCACLGRLLAPMRRDN